MQRANINLHIEKLVLHGFAPGDRMAMQLALSQELNRLLVENGVPASFLNDATIGSLNAGEIRVEPSGQPATIGAQVAQNIYGGMTGE